MATGRPAVVVFDNAFHGRTLLSMTMTSKTHPYKAGLGPFAPEVYRVPFAQQYRGPDARAALDANAPEEVLRIVEQALPGTRQHQADRHPRRRPRPVA